MVCHARLLMLLAGIAGALTACAFSSGPGLVGSDRCERTRGQQILTLLNTARARDALAPLEVDLDLIEAAQAHAQDMARGGFLGHQGSDGSLPADRADRAGYRWVFVAENTSAGYQTAAAAFAGWMASPSHRANNLHVEAEHVGIGYAENGATDWRTYWVAVFGASSSPPLSPPGGCHP